MAKTEDAWWTPGHMAASCGNLECLNFLITVGIDVNAGAGPNHTSTLLHEAAHNGHHDCVKRLLQCGANPSLYDGHDLPHHLASRYGHPKVLDVLLTYFKKIENTHLINAFTNVDPKSNALTFHNALHMASLYGHKKCIKVLLKHKAKHMPNGMGQHPVTLTASKMHIECLKVLLKNIKTSENDAFVETHAHFSALHYLCMKNYRTTDKTIACACLLLNSGIDVNQFDQEWDISPCLFIAARNGAIGLVEYLLLSGANPYLCPSLQNRTLNNPNIRICSDILDDARAEAASLLTSCRLMIRQLVGARFIERIYELPLPRSLQNFVFHGHFRGDGSCNVGTETGCS